MVDSKQTTSQLAPGVELQHHFDIMLPYNASSGRQKVRVDFQLQAERPYRFSVYRQMDIGLGEVYVEIATGLNDRGELEVEQRLVNATDDPVSFGCQLYVPDRRRLMTQIIGLVGADDLKIYRLPDGKELLGKTLWLRAQEIGGPRMLNYRFVAEP